VYALDTNFKKKSKEKKEILPKVSSKSAKKVTIWKGGGEVYLSPQAFLAQSNK